MPTIKCAAHAKKPAKEVNLTDDILEMSVTVGYKGADISPLDIHKLDRLLNEHCLSGVVALEREDTKNHLHFQMVCRARGKLGLSFALLTIKYTGWYSIEK